jgi:nucleotide-binding universal stress UspA family protein
VLSTHVAEREGAIVVLGGHRHRGLFDAGTTRELIARPLCPVWVQGTRPWTEVRRILVPLDLSPGSGPILSFARDLAVASGASITVLHCFEPPTYAYAGVERADAIYAQLEEQSREEFTAFMAREQSAESNLESRFEKGELAETVLSAQSEHDLIVMGTHGHSGIARVLFGSHAYRILSETQTPVVVVPQPVVV